MFIDTDLVSLKDASLVWGLNVTTDLFNSLHVEDQGVVKQLLKLNSAKACGPDMPPAMILKELAHDIAAYIPTIFQKSLDTGRIPQDWRSEMLLTSFPY